MNITLDLSRLPVSAQSDILAQAQVNLVAILQHRFGLLTREALFALSVGDLSSRGMGPEYEHSFGNRFCARLAGLELLESTFPDDDDPRHRTDENTFRTTPLGRMVLALLKPADFHKYARFRMNNIPDPPANAEDVFLLPGRADRFTEDMPAKAYIVEP